MVIRPEEWELVGGDPAPGGPDAWGRLARDFGDSAKNAGDAHGQLLKLRDAVDESIWRGKAADAFREEVGKLPDHLAKLHDSYDRASTAVAGYGATLRILKSRASAILADAQSAHLDQTTTEQTRDTAVAADPTTSTTAYEDAIAAARSRLQQAKDQIEHIRQERWAAEKKAMEGLGKAHDVGMHNQGLFGRIVHAGLRAVAKIAEWGSFLLAVTAIVVVIVVAVGFTGGLSIPALLAGMAAAVPYVNLATGLTGAALASKSVSKALFADEDLEWSDITKEAFVTGVAFGGGKLLEVIKPFEELKLVQTRQVVHEFTSVTRTVQPGRLLGILDDAVIFEAPRAVPSITHFRVEIIETSIRELPVRAAWDTGWAYFHDIPKFEKEHGIPLLLGLLTPRLPGITFPSGAGRHALACSIHKRLAVPTG